MGRGTANRERRLVRVAHGGSGLLIDDPVEVAGLPAADIRSRTPSGDDPRSAADEAELVAHLAALGDVRLPWAVCLIHRSSVLATMGPEGTRLGARPT